MFMSSLHQGDIFCLHWSSPLAVHIILVNMNQDKYKKGDRKFSGLVWARGTFFFQFC